MVNKITKPVRSALFQALNRDQIKQQELKYWPFVKFLITIKFKIKPVTCNLTQKHDASSIFCLRASNSRTRGKTNKQTNKGEKKTPCIGTCVMLTAQSIEDFWVLGFTSRFLWPIENVSYSPILLRLLQVEVAVMVCWGYFAATAMLW